MEAALAEHARPAAEPGCIARRRIDSLADPGSFQPLRTAVASRASRRSRPGDGLLAGSARIG
ncbi:MAG: hypothetical protein KJ006_10575, partial [Thermoleophilia bacterium]|nr:hypothetical protein [Thermoleophilia bacterium]